MGCLFSKQEPLLENDTLDQNYLYPNHEPYTYVFESNFEYINPICSESIISRPIMTII